jgi:hypothetical protein
LGLQGSGPKRLLEETIEREYLLTDPRKVRIAILESLQFKRPGVLDGHDDAQNLEMRDDQFQEDLIDGSVLV